MKTILISLLFAATTVAADPPVAGPTYGLGDTAVVQTVVVPQQQVTYGLVQQQACQTGFCPLPQTRQPLLRSRTRTRTVTTSIAPTTTVVAAPVIMEAAPVCSTYVQSAPVVMAEPCIQQEQIIVSEPCQPCQVPAPVVMSSCAPCTQSAPVQSSCQLSDSQLIGYFQYAKQSHISWQNSGLGSPDFHREWQYVYDQATARLGGSANSCNMSMPVQQSVSTSTTRTRQAWRPLRNFANRRNQTVSNCSTGYSGGFGINANQTSGGLAQQKANQMANRGIRGHVGGSLGGYGYEGVGWGPTANSAVTNSCYWGERPVGEVGVAQGRNGMFYATVLYR